MAMEQQDVPHLIVLQHGLHGSPSDFSNFKKLIENTSSSRKIICYCGERNSEAWSSTHDGVDICGKRLAEEIETLIEKEKLPKGTKLTLAGHSFGGLLVRYAAGHLWSTNKLQHFELENLITFATPHCGARRSPRDFLFNPLVSVYCNNVIGRTGLQLMLEDSDGSNGEPILKTISEPSSCYFEALQLFKNKVLYSNISNDIPVPYCTAAILPRNPYSRKKLTYMTKYPHIVDTLLTLENGEVVESEVPNETQEMTAEDLSIDPDTIPLSPQTQRRVCSPEAASILSPSTFLRIPSPASIWNRVQRTSLLGFSFASSSSPRTFVASAGPVAPRDIRHSRSTPNFHFHGDKRAEVLHFLLDSLQQVNWQRHDAHFYGPMAHEFIIAKRNYMPGFDVVQHALENYILKPDIQEGLADAHETSIM